jgi:FtsZ-interacting cell division protein YlmF
MAFAEFISSLADKLQQSPFGGGSRSDDEPNLANGGTSGYHPVNAKSGRRGARNRQTPPARGGQAAGQQQAYPGQPQAYRQNWAPQGQPQGYPQGGQMPQGYPQGQMPQGQMPQSRFQGYQGGQQNQAPQGQQPQRVQQGWAPQTQPQAAGPRPVDAQRQGTGNQSGPNPVFPQNQGGWSGPQWAQQQTPYQPKFATQPDRNRRFGREEQPAQAEAPADNVSYMPGVFRDEQGSGRHHVERLTQPMSASTCYRLIEFMRNQESVIVNTELIVDERERQRCLDILFGAAYAMNCTFTRIAAKCIYLIAPRTVAVISYESIRQMNEQDMAMNWPHVETERPAAFRSFREAR